MVWFYSEILVYKSFLWTFYVVKVYVDVIAGTSYRSFWINGTNSMEFLPLSFSYKLLEKFHNEKIGISLTYIYERYVRSNNSVFCMFGNYAKSLSTQQISISCSKIYELINLTNYHMVIILLA